MKCSKSLKIFIIKEYRHIFLSIRELTLQVTIIELRKVLNHTFHYDLCKYFTAWVVNISNSLPHSVVESGTVNLFKAYLEKTKPPGMQASINRCLSQARINWEGCDRKGVRRKNAEFNLWLGGDGGGG